MNMLLKRFLTDTSGATMVEYGVLIALIGTAIIAAFDPVASQLSTSWTTLDTNMGG